MTSLPYFGGALGTTAPFCVLFMHGPGGVGKTSLLGQFIACCDTLGIPTATLDARTVEPQPEAFLSALQRAMGTQEPPLSALGHVTQRHVITVDTYELLTPLDACYERNSFRSSRITSWSSWPVASRRFPPGAWIPVGRIWCDRCRCATAPGRGPRLPEPARHSQRSAWRCTRFHARASPGPLFVAEVFAQREEFVFRAEEAPDVVKVLLEQLVQKVPGPAHRAALETAALVRLTTESLLGEVLGVDDAHELFEWLRGLSFIQAGPLGLFPHDLVRDALSVDLRWRNPEWYAELHRRARHYYASRLSQTRGVEQQRVLFDYVYLHRDNPLMRPYLEWQETGTTMPDSLRDGDREPLRALVLANEGIEAAKWFDFWAERQPDGFVVYRDSEGNPSGLLVGLALDQVDPVDRDVDPATARAWSFLERNAALRPGERSTYFRFWMARDGYQSVSAIQSLIFGRAAQHYLTTPRLAFSFFSAAEPEFWAPMFTHVDLPLQPEIAFRTDEREFGVFVHDWRVTPPMTWLDLLAEREMEMETQTVPPTPAVPLVVLSRPDFEQAVRDALRSLTHAAALESNPLLRSRLVVDQVGSGAATADRVAALRQTLRDAIHSLGTSPRRAKLQRALHHTYVQPAPTQDQAAELLDLPFSTYRRHLTSGIAAVTELLWQREVRGASQEPTVAAPMANGG